LVYFHQNKKDEDQGEKMYDQNMMRRNPFESQRLEGSVEVGHQDKGRVERSRGMETLIPETLDVIKTTTP
jgi:hypothetical protein